MLESGRTDYVVVHRVVSKETGFGLLVLAWGALLVDRPMSADLVGTAIMKLVKLRALSW
jgi:hypothetical protein